MNDTAELSKKLTDIIADPALVVPVGTRGRKFAQDAQQDIGFPQRLELILERAARRERPTTSTPSTASGRRDEIDRFPFTRMATTALAAVRRCPAMVIPAGTPKSNLADAQSLLIEIKQAVGDGSLKQLSLAQAVEVEIAIASAENDVYLPARQRRL